jgi:hypothetical protein
LDYFGSGEGKGAAVVGMEMNIRVEKILRTGRL